jgi:solute carrier family 50 (sugar transporter)
MAAVAPLIPYIGVITSTLIFLSPINDIKNIRTSSHINALPYPMVFNNALGWTLYSLICKDSFIFFPNIIGLSLSIYYTVTAYQFADRHKSNQILFIWISGSLIAWIGAYVSFIIFGDMEIPQRKSLMGYACVFLLVLFYTSPLATFKQVIRSRNAASFSYGLSLACFVNGLVWAYYGIQLSDPFIWCPNLIGVGVAVLQLVLKVLFKEGSVSTRQWQRVDDVHM